MGIINFKNINKIITKHFLNIFFLIVYSKSLGIFAEKLYCKLFIVKKFCMHEA